nr:MAG TPA: hypothetical protein [Caudoviricetes sp.]
MKQLMKEKVSVYVGFASAIVGILHIQFVVLS